MLILEGKRIFILEDDLNNRSVMQMLLEQQGAQVSFERWGRQTVEKLTAFAPVDLILLDLMLPNNVSGYDVYERICQIPEFVDVPAVVVTAADPAIEMPKARSLGLAGFISKPVKFQSFADHIKNVLDGKPVWVAS